MTDPITISRKSFVQIVGNRAGYYPNPDDPGDPNNPFGPFGPGGPVLRRLLEFQRLRGLDRVALNPQPLPPKEILAVALSQSVTDHLAQIHALADTLSGDVADDLRNGGLRFLDEFGEWCGTMTHRELIAALIRRLLGKRPPPPPPEPEPWWDERLDASDLITIGVQMQAAFEQIADERLAGSLEQVGSKLMDSGLAMLG